MTDMARRVEAIEALLVEKGLLTTDAVDAVVDLFSREVGPMRGARIVSRAWTEPAYRQRLLIDAPAAIAELGFGGAETEHLIVVANTATVHNMIVCTLCSCYPWAVLGLPPRWYKSPAYRSRAVLEPRAVLAEFGTVLPPETEVRVWDSSAELRYLVLPLRPAGTEALSEDDLAALVTRDHMIGVRR
jgi:nitrile hydratase